MTLTDSPRAVVVAPPETDPPVGATSPASQAASRPLPQIDPGHRSAVTRAACAGVSLFDPTLTLAADVVDDLERVRIANANRLLILTRTETDSDGQERGFGLALDHPDVARLAGIVDALAVQEHQAVLNLQRAMRRHPLGLWVEAQKGVGLKQAARLLATIGDPYWNTLHNRPRTVSELWAYCGLHVLPAGQRTLAAHAVPAGGDQTGDPGQSMLGDHSRLAGVAQVLPASLTAPDAPTLRAGGAQSGDPDQQRSDTHGLRVGVAAKRRKGQRANWSTPAKMRAYLVATSCIKQAASPYRSTYVARRAHTAGTHPDWTAGHSHNDALRVTSKAILRDLWREARRLHEVPA